jgi:hypothetical protein
MSLIEQEMSVPKAKSFASCWRRGNRDLCSLLRTQGALGHQQNEQLAMGRGRCSAVGSWVAVTVMWVPVLPLPASPVDTMILSQLHHHCPPAAQSDLCLTWAWARAGLDRRVVSASSPEASPECLLYTHSCCLYAHGLFLPVAALTSSALTLPFPSDGQDLPNATLPALVLLGFLCC